MPVYQDTERKTWYVKLYYTDYTGARKQKMKRGFKLQREAKEWERHFLETLQGTPDMTFGLCMSCTRPIWQRTRRNLPDETAFH